MNKEELLKYYQTYRLYVFPGIIALSSLILIIFVIYPQTNKLINNQLTRGEVLNKSEFLEAKAQSLESYDATDLERKVKFALGFYPLEKDFVSAISLLQNLSAQSGYNITSIAVGAGSSKDANTQSFNIKLDILGPSQLLPLLLSNIENSSRLMRINSVETIEGRGDKGATITLSVDVLYSSAPKEFGALDSPLPKLSEKDEEVITKLSQSEGSTGTISPEQITPQLGSRGKENPFE